MKKLIGILFIISSIFVLSSFSGHYDMKCWHCVESGNKNHVYGEYGCSGCHAWRAYGEEAKHPGYMVYKCQHGHTMLVPKDSDGSDPSEIKVYDYQNKEWRNLDSKYLHK